MKFEGLNGSASTLGLTPIHRVINSPQSHHHKQRGETLSVFALLPLTAKTTHFSSTWIFLLSGCLRALTTWRATLSCENTKTSLSPIKTYIYFLRIGAKHVQREALWGVIVFAAAIKPSVFPSSFNPHPHHSFLPQCPSSSPLVVCCVTAAALFHGGEMNRLWAVIRYTAESMCSGARPGGGVWG